MKIQKISALLLTLVTAFMFVSCDMINNFIESRTRAIPLIQIYNANLEKSLRMVPNDTLYVEVQGLEPEKEYIVQCLDPTDKVITEIITLSDENGVIDPSPLWYDIGFKKDSETGKPVLPEGELGLTAFSIRVTDKEERTNFSLPFFIVYSTENLERPQPVVMAGKRVDGQFEMENAFYSDKTDLNNIDDSEGLDSLYVKVHNMTPMQDGEAGLSHEVRIWILPFTGENYKPGEIIADLSDDIFYHDFTVEELMNADNGIQIPWPDAEPADGAIDVTGETNYIIPDWAKGRGFSVFLDMMDRGSSGIYEVLKEGTESFYLDSIDGNGAAGFIVKEPPITAAEYVPMNLASGGLYRWDYTNWKYDYDYRDQFQKHGYDTKFSSHSGEFWGYGVKVIWNPYQTPAGWQASGAEMPSSFWGQTVDVYIVDSTQKLFKDENIISAEGTWKRRVPVQYGCSNGWWQQTIWRAPMIPGDYMIVVDMDRSGTITADDLVDNVKKDFQVDDSDVYANVWKDGDEFIGFTIVDSY